MKYRINAEDVTLPDGTVRTEADYERMALEAETTEPDYDAIEARFRAQRGRPSLGEGISPVLQVRLDRETQTRLAALAELDHTTPSAVARDAIKAFIEGRRKAS